MLTRSSSIFQVIGLVTGDGFKALKAYTFQGICLENNLIHVWYRGEIQAG